MHRNGLDAYSQLFQSLIGTIKTLFLGGNPFIFGVSIPHRYDKNVGEGDFNASDIAFQSLIGTIKTQVPHLVCGTRRRFNPS